MGNLVLIGGGARSGKSTYALNYAQRCGSRRLFLATAQAFDDEMVARIGHHRAERTNTFTTVEEPLDLTGALANANAFDVVLVDCLTLWLSNLLLRGDDENTVRAEVQNLVACLARRPQTTTVILVTNEVGLGIVPEHPLGRLFRDVAGWTHQTLAGVADEVFFAAMGLVIRLLPAPLTAYRPGQLP